MNNTDITTLLKQMEESKKRVQQLQLELDKERATGKQYYEKFMLMQDELRQAFGVVEPATGRRARGPNRRERTPEANLKVSAGKTIDRAKKDGKKPAEAKELATQAALSVAKEKYGLTSLPAIVLKQIDKQITKKFGTTKK
jgi:hypothetical protein